MKAVSFGEQAPSRADPNNTPLPGRYVA